MSRKGVNLESLGKVAELLPTSSPFRVGMTGRPRKGFRPFRIAGRIQLSTGTGTWDEWYIAFDDGRYGWIAEAQGAFYVMKPMPNPKAPSYTAIQPGMALDFSPYGRFTVSDRRQALYASAEGELPFAAPPGAVFMYADLSGPDGSFATLDYGDDPELDAFFVGVEVSLQDLGIEGLTAWGERKTAAKASSLNCPSCGGPLQLSDPSATVRIACVYCGSLLGEESGKPGKFEILERLKKPPFRPSLPLGSRGSLSGHPYIVLGAMLKSCVVEGTEYFWKEYLLKETTTESYHWLVESNGHFSLVMPIALGGVEITDKIAIVQGRRFKHFQGTRAVVKAVLGEFYWEVAQGEAVEVNDYVAPPEVLSLERAAQEVSASRGAYVPKEEIERGFALPKPLPEPEGIANNQPWPRANEAPLVYRTALALAAATFLLFVFFSVRASRQVVYEGRHEVIEQAASTSSTTSSTGEAAEDPVILTAPFDIGRSGNVMAEMQAPTSNNWVLVGGTLIEEKTGEARTFSLLSDAFSGVDGGERWSEGSQSRRVFLSQVPAGRYVLRLESDFDKGKAPPYFTIKLVSGVPRTSRLFLIWFLLSLGPIAYLISRLRFESQRWAESDHPIFTSSGDSGDSDD